MKEQLPTAYDPGPVEKKWYSRWNEENFFSADPSSGKPPYTIIMPPPNVTGALHMGHALVDTLQDVLIRFKRMKGFEALWLPGTDHAGISTQTVVERRLLEKTGKRRVDFPREEFLKHIWEWKESSEGRIIDQLKKLGCSCDWSRRRFTMDEAANRSVKTIFKKLFDEGLIYRGDYLVNWDPITQTALADDEVEYEERRSSLWTFRYPLETSGEALCIATTRPETMLGDTAVAVSPSDPRFVHLIGKRVKLPLTGRLIPIIADHHVDPKFGTGAVKITPAHDPNDWEIGQRHDLPLINVMTPDGKIEENFGLFAGLSMLEARERVVEEMKNLGLLEKVEPHTHRVGTSYRSKAVIEPYLSKQWFIKMSPFKKKLISAVKQKKVKLRPEYWEKTYFHWIKNLRDWCISRQLWWGHRIPIWYNVDDPSQMVCYDGEGLPPEALKNPEAWYQDPDVLDTWFSSALWPLTTLGWPEKSEALQKFYPTSILITGHDILFFWVARMVMMGEYATGEVPFHETFIHGLIYGKSYWREKRDSISYVTPEERNAFELGATPPPDVESKWEKMSKSKGNVIDPIEIINLYGADAMRIALCSTVTNARQIDLDRRKFEEFKNFINKMWNGARFIFMNVEDLSPKEFANGLDRALFTLEDRWILSSVNQMVEKMQKTLASYQFDQAAISSYEFYWDEFCAYYLELVKPTLFSKKGSEAARRNKQKILIIVLTALVRLMHPIIPFITEELFSHVRSLFTPIAQIPSDPYTEQTIVALSAKACIVAPYPEVICKEDIDPEVEKTFSYLREIVRAIRNIRAEMGIPPSLPIQIYFSGDDDKILSQNISLLHSLIKIEKVHFNEALPSSLCSVASIDRIRITIPMPKELREKEIKRLEKEKEKVLTQIASFTKQLANENFVKKAPRELVEKTKENLKKAEETLKEIEDALR